MNPASSSPLPGSAPGAEASAAFALLCACTRVDLSPERASPIANWDVSVIDWPAFLHLAEHHGVLSLAARNLLPHASRLPAPIVQELRAQFDANLRRNLWFASELVRIVEQFEQNGLRAIPYKGPVLAESVYGDLALRTFGDLDFLIAPRDIARARQALAGLGYRPGSECTPAVERLWLRTGYELAFDSGSGKNLVELQWALLPRFYAVDLPVETLLARAGLASVAGRPLPSLSPEDLLLVLCLHAAKHLWMRLLWVADIAETVRSQTIDYSAVESHARSLGVQRIVGISLWLSGRVLGTQIPEAASHFICAPEVETLGATYASRLSQCATYDFDSPDYFRRLLPLREQHLDRARYLWRLLWTPGPGEIAAIRLPEPLFPLYRVVRLLRLLRKLVTTSQPQP